MASGEVVEFLDLPRVEHDPTDLVTTRHHVQLALELPSVAALVLGRAWFAVCSIAFGGRFLRFGAPVEIAEQAQRRSPRWSTRDG
jgi:hypothetical protein